MYIRYINFNQKKPLSTTVTEKSRNFELNLQNYSLHT
jgi:hypothetical protein